jgi:hypothetical protein
MCTLVVAAGIVPDAPLVVVANRDEVLSRPSRPPFHWPGTDFVAPRDEVAGGTWLGYTARGLFVGILNRFLGPNDPARRSRGALVVDTLGYRSAAEAHAALAELDPHRYNGFHLVYADARAPHDVFATISDGTELSQLRLGEGFHVITERAFGADRANGRARLERIRAAWIRSSGSPFDPARATTVLAEHDEASPIEGTCIHLGERGYGTKSGMVLAVKPERATMLWAEGPPCVTPFFEVDLAINVSPAPKTG